MNARRVVASTAVLAVLTAAYLLLDPHENHESGLHKPVACPHPSGTPRLAGRAHPAPVPHQTHDSTDAGKPEAAPVTVRVTDGTGTPVPEALVWVAQRTQTPNGTDDVASPVRAGAEGIARLLLCDHREVAVYATHPEAGRSGVAVAHPGEDMVLVCLTGAVVRILPHSESGGAIPSGVATLVNVPYGAESASRSVAVIDGEAIFTGVPDGDYECLVTVWGFESKRVHLDSVHARDEMTRSIVLRPKLELEFDVECAGATPPDELVLRLLGRDKRTLRRNSRGLFSLPAASRGTWGFELISGEGRWQGAFVCRRGHFLPHRRANEVVILSLKETASLRGQAPTTTGGGIALLGYELRPVGNHIVWGERKTTVDAAGRFQFANIPRDCAYVVTVEKRGVSWPAIVGVLDQHVKAVFVPADDGRELEILVVDDSGRSVEGARVEWSQVPPAVVRGGRTYLMGHLSPVHSGITDAEGRVVIAVPRSRSIEIEVGAKGFLTRGPRTVRPSEGRTILVRLGRPVWIRGVACTLDGAAVSGASVEVVTREHEMLLTRTVTDALGRFRLRFDSGYEGVLIRIRTTTGLNWEREWTRGTTREIEAMLR